MQFKTILCSRKKNRFGLCHVYLGCVVKCELCACQCDCMCLDEVDGDHLKRGINLQKCKIECDHLCNDRHVFSLHALTARKAHATLIFFLDFSPISLFTFTIHFVHTSLIVIKVLEIPYRRPTIFT